MKYRTQYAAVIAAGIAMFMGGYARTQSSTGSAVFRMHGIMMMIAGGFIFVAGSIMMFADKLYSLMPGTNRSGKKLNK